MPDEATRERLRGLLDYADYQLLRGNFDAAREALTDAEQIDAALTNEEDFEW
jgi:hypothetical protein